MRLRLALLIAFVLLLVGCAEALPSTVLHIARWTFVPPEGAPREVTLPAHLDLPDHVTQYRLRTRVPLGSELSGRALTLAFVQLPARASLRAQGQPALALDEEVSTVYRVSGAQRWRIPEELTRGQYLDLELDLLHRSTLSGWIDCVPRLSIAGPLGDPFFLAIRTWNESMAVFGIAIVLASALSYLLIYLLDRSRQAHGWFVLEALGGVAFPIFATGITQLLLDTRDVVVMGLQLLLGAISAVAFVCSYFGLPFPARKLLLAWVVFAALSVAVVGPFSMRPFALVVVVAVAVSAQAQIYLFWKLWRQRPRPRNVPLVALAWPAAGLLGTIEILWWSGFGSPFKGFQGGSAAISLVAFLRIAALGREHVRSLRKTDRLNEELAARVNLLEEKNVEVGRLNEELRRQIASRSAQLADALARIGARHSGVVILDVGNTVAGRYRVVRPIASGGMGSVYEVERMTDGVRFALKVLHGRNEPLSLARFAREAQIAAQIHHENVVSIVDMDVDSEGYVFLVMELVRGVPLSELRDRFGDLAFAIPVLRQIAEGLAAIHEQGIVHRDLKPANVLIIDPDGAPKVKITDFGVAMLGDSAEDRLEAARSSPEREARLSGPDDERTAVDKPGKDIPAKDLPLATKALPLPSTPAPSRPSGRPPPASTPLTRTGVVVGTPLYMAPELFEGARNARPAADVFGLGVVAFFLLTNQHPFPERKTNANDVREAPLISTRRSDLPDEIANAVDTALALDPNERPTAAEFAAAFSSVALGRERAAG